MSSNEEKRTSERGSACVCLIFIELLNINILVFGNDVHIILNTSQNTAFSYLLTPYFCDSSWLVLLLHDQQSSRFNCISMKVETKWPNQPCDISVFLSCHLVFLFNFWSTYWYCHAGLLSKYGNLDRKKNTTFLFYPWLTIIETEKQVGFPH